MTWTNEDERTLNELQERKQQYENAMADCVGRVVDQHFRYNTDSGEIRDALIRNATQIRKVLEPFDKEFKA